jgi:hypothetical protein
MQEQRQSEMRMIPIDRIEVLNPRERNNRVFEEIVANIKTIGLKKPITVTAREKADGSERYLLVCGEGRVKAFRALGETTIPALVVRFVVGLQERQAHSGAHGGAIELSAYHAHAEYAAGRTVIQWQDVDFAALCVAAFAGSGCRKRSHDLPSCHGGGPAQAGHH